MKYLNSMTLVLGVVIAVFLQAPGVQSDSTNVKGGQIVPALPCEYTGYTEYDCSFVDKDCTAGTVKSATSVSSTTEDFRSLGTYTVRGNCTGNPGCVTPQTLDLTSAGC